MQHVSWICNLCLALCGIPLAYTAWRNKSISINAAFLWLWFVGEVGLLVVVMFRGDWPFLINYVVNTICLMVIWYYQENQEYHNGGICIDSTNLDRVAPTTPKRPYSAPGDL